MQLYGLIVTHLWLASLVVLYIGYLTYADYYDKFSESLISDYKVLSITTGVLCFLLFAAIVPDNRKTPILEIYYAMCFLGSIILTAGSVVLFFRHSYSIRQYFGRKRNKV